MKLQMKYQMPDVYFFGHLYLILKGYIFYKNKLYKNNKTKIETGTFKDKKLKSPIFLLKI